MIALLLAFAQDTYQKPEAGLTFKAPEGFELRTAGFKFPWKGCAAEFQSPDGAVCGVLFFWASRGSSASIADAREKQIKDRATEFKKVDVSDAKPGRLRREFVSTSAKGSTHYAFCYATQGSNTAELIVWTAEAQWEAQKKSVDLAFEGLSLGKSWSCPACKAEIETNARSCKACSASLAVPDADLDAWAKKHSIQIVTDPKAVYPVQGTTGKISGKPAPKEAVEAYCKLLARELRRYPDDVFAKLGISRIVLGKEIYLGSTRRGALADFGTDTIHCEVAEGVTEPDYQAATFHHELFHFIDTRDDGQAAKDPEWEALNPKGFRYGPRKDQSAKPSDANPGFLTTYALSAVSEDKADTFGNMMARPKLVAERAAKDDVIRKKTEHLRKTLAKWCPSIDDKFWETK